MRNCKIIALDLDGTLLDSEKRLSPENYAALAKASAAGIEIVPTTGRFFDAMPQVVRDLPFLHYAITINGAEVYDIRARRAVCRAEIPLQQAEEIMHYLDGFPVVYDCYMDGWGYMTRTLQEKCGEYAPDIHYFEMLTRFRKPVDNLIDFIRERGHDVQKIQFFMKDASAKLRWMDELEQRFPDIIATSSVVNNIELNNVHASKGKGLAALCSYLGCDISETIAFGDGLNDLSMIRAAGLGVAMENAVQCVKDAADVITADCDSSGVAKGIEAYCFGC